jgi:DNA-binding MarR family transcriptional regulator
MRDEKITAQVEGLADLAAPLYRGLKLAVGRRLGYPPLANAKVEVLSAVRRAPGISVREVAASLKLAPNTVSTLVGELVDAGLLRRVPCPNDRRAAQLWATEAAVERMTNYQRVREEVMKEALGRLCPEERAAIEAALPALARLSSLLAEPPH